MFAIRLNKHATIGYLFMCLSTVFLGLCFLLCYVRVMDIHGITHVKSLVVEKYLEKVHKFGVWYISQRPLERLATDYVMGLQSFQDRP